MLIDGIFCSAWFHFAARSGGNWCHIRRRWFPLRVTHLRHCEARHNQGHSAAVEWSKITRVRRGKKQEGGNIFAATHSSNRLQELESVSPAALLSNFCQLCAHRSALKEKVEFSARRVGTNGLNSLQLSLDKLKTNTCSPSKNPVTRSVSFFPKDKQRQ